MRKLLITITILILCSNILSQAMQADTLFAHKTNMEMTLDGKPDEAIWQHAPVLKYWDVAEHSENIIYCQAVWDENFLYVIHQVVDEDITYDENFESEWNEEGVEIFLNPQNVIFEGENRISFEEAGHIQFIVTTMYGVYQNPLIWEPDPAPGEFAEITEDDSSYIIEEFIPLADCEIGAGEMAIGRVIGCMLACNDKESDGEKTQFSNTGINAAFHTTENWGWIKILDEPQTGVRKQIDELEKPTVFQLLQNYPNPFNPTTNIDYSLERDSHIRIAIYNVSGQLITTLVEKDMDAGLHSVTWDGINHSGQKVPSGLYFCTLSSTGIRETRKMILSR